MFGEDNLQVPERGVLLHIGPHKTGTTAIQGALHNARPLMAEHGVIYAGRSRQHQMGALAITAGKGLSGDRPARQEDWEKLVADVERASDQRVIVSSEFFDDATAEVAGRVVEGLGGERVHVLVTLRPLAKIMPSAWQQYVRNRLRMPYDQWLDAMLTQPPENAAVTATFWPRHRHADLVERWASIVGPERLLVVVVDDTAHDMLLRTFEQLVDLPADLLVAETDSTNRSLTAPEAEAVRLLNEEFYDRKWPATAYNDLVRKGLVKGMQKHPPPADAPRITTPAWAVDRANEIAAEASERIRASGVRVLGDLTILSSVRPETGGHRNSGGDFQAPLDIVQETIALVEARLAEQAAETTERKLAQPHLAQPQPAEPPPTESHPLTAPEADASSPARPFLTRVRDRITGRHRPERASRLP